MSRKVAVILASVVVLAIAAASSAAPGAGGDPPDRPNFLFILADDLDTERTSPAIWDALDYTKRNIGDRGMTFDNAFTPHPQCCPSRASSMTGKYAHNNGVFNNWAPRGGFSVYRDNGNEEDSLPIWLDRAGYKLGYVGKYFNGTGVEPTHEPPGWDSWYILNDDTEAYSGLNYDLNENGHVKHYGSERRDYLTDVIKRKADSFLRTIDPEKGPATEDQDPFLLWVAPTAPHQNIDVRPGDSNPWAAAKAPRAANSNEALMRDKPKWLQGTYVARGTEGGNDADYQRRMGSLLAVDDLVERLVNTLAELNELDNTYIIFTSDNGYTITEPHHVRGKGYTSYPEAHEVPLLVRGPGIEPGSRQSAMALSIDHAPTLATLAGVEVPADVDGRSLAPLLHGQRPPDWRTDFLLEYRAGWGDGLPEQDQVCNALNWRSPTSSSVRNEQYIYTEYHDDPDEYRWCKDGTYPTGKEYELYPVGPNEWQNDNMLGTAKDRRDNKALWDVMRARLEELRDCAGPSCP